MLQGFISLSQVIAAVLMMTFDTRTGIRNAKSPLLLKTITSCAALFLPQVRTFVKREDSVFLHSWKTDASYCSLGFTLFPISKKIRRKLVEHSGWRYICLLKMRLNRRLVFELPPGSPLHELLILKQVSVYLDFFEKNCAVGTGGLVIAYRTTPVSPFNLFFKAKLTQDSELIPDAF